MRVFAALECNVVADGAFCDNVEVACVLVVLHDDGVACLDVDRLHSERKLVKVLPVKAVEEEVRLERGCDQLQRRVILWHLSSV